MKKLLISILFISFFIDFSFSQSAQNKIKTYDLNEKFLEHLIKTKIDSVRNNLGLSTLINDSILYVASKHHADYLNVNNKFSHNELNNTGFITPQDRVNSYGGKNYSVGENIIKSHVNIPVSSKNKKGTYINNTYDDIANDFVIGWINSPGHYANMITPRYNTTGLSISVNSAKSTIYCVQKFALLAFEYQLSEYKTMFNYSNYTPPPPITSFKGLKAPLEEIVYPWNIKAPKDSIKLCATCNELIDSHKYHYKGHFKFIGKNIFYKSYNIEFIEEILKTKKSGLAIEVVEYNPYDCGNPAYYTLASRRNQWSILNGEVMSPIYNNEIKKGLIANKKKGLLKKKIKIYC